MEDEGPWKQEEPCHLPIHQHVLLHPEAVRAPVSTSGVAVRASGVARLPGIVGVFFVAVNFRGVAPTLSLQGRELSRLLPHTGRVNHQCVLGREEDRGKDKMRGEKRWGE